MSKITSEKPSLKHQLKRVLQASFFFFPSPPTFVDKTKDMTTKQFYSISCYGSSWYLGKFPSPLQK